MNEIATINMEKIFFKHVLNNKQFNYPNEIFGNNDIRNVYIYIKEYYEEYKSIPTNKILIEELNSTSPSIINILLSLDDLSNYDPKWIVDKFEEYLKKQLVKIEVNKIIEDVRNGNNDKVFSKLNLEITDVNKTDKKHDYKKHTKEENKAYSKYLSTAPMNKIVKKLITEYDNKIDYKIKPYLIYPLLKEEQIGILFGKTGDGKTVLAIEFADMIANGKSKWNTFRVDTPPQDVLYIDFELGASSVQNRYKNRIFSNKLHISSVDVWAYNSAIGFDKKQNERVDKAIEFIEGLATEFKSKVIFIDNLSNIADQLEKASDADRFIMDLIGRMKALELTIMFIGHTPKIYEDRPLETNQLKGSSSLSKSFETIIGFKRTSEENISYIKQCKGRDLDPIFDHEVAKFQFNYDKHNWSMDYIGTDDEQNLITSKKVHNKYDNNTMIEILYENQVNKLSERKISEKYNIPKSSLYHFKLKLKNNINNLDDEYQEYCKNKSYQENTYNNSNDEIDEFIKSVHIK